MGSGVMDNGMIEKSKKIRWKTDEYMVSVPVWAEWVRGFMNP